MVGNPGKILISKILALKMFKTENLGGDAGPLASLYGIYTQLRGFWVGARLDVRSGCGKHCAERSAQGGLGRGITGE